MPNKLNKLLLSLSISSLGLSAGALTYADESNNSFSLEEIVVTAQKREERLQDVPFSVSVVSGKDIDDAKIVTIEDVVSATASVQFGKAGSSRGEGLQIRGIGTVSFADGIEGAVGTVIDGVVMGRQSAGLNDLFDVERIEILRGPQGTLFGKNTSAGLVNIVTKKPTAETEGALKLSYGTFNEVLANAVVSGPLAGDDLLGRLAVFSNTHDGTIDQINPNLPEDEVNDKDEWGFKAKLLYTPTDDLSLYLISEFVKEDQNCCVRTERSYPTDPNNPFYALGVGGTVVPGSDNRKNQASSITTQTSETQAVSLEVEYAFANDLTFKSITATRDFETYEFNDTDNGPTVLVEFAGTDTDITQYSQEFQILSPADSALKYVVGAIYFEQEVDSLTDFTGQFAETTNTSVVLNIDPNTGLPIGILGFPGAGVSGLTSPTALTATTQPQVTTTKNTAIFGQLTYELSDLFTITAGARFLEEELDVDFTRSSIAQLGQLIEGPFAGGVVTGLVLPGGFGANLDLDAVEKDTAFTGMVSLQYFPSDETTAYFTLSQGYKGSGIEFGTNSVGVLDPEVPTNVEIGVNSHLFDRKLYLSVSAFVTDYKDFQSGISKTTGFETTNVDNVRSQGVEIEFIGKPASNLTLSGGVAWINAEVESFPDLVTCHVGQTAAQGCNNGAQTLEGKTMPNSPEYAANLSINYDFYQDDNKLAFIRTDYSWQDDKNFDLLGDPNQVQEAYGLLNARLGVVFNNGLEVAAWGKNILNETYAYRVNENLLFLGTGAYQQYIGMEAQAGVDLKYTF